MRSWLKLMLLAGFIVFAVWLLVIFYWRSSMHMPSTSDVVTYLVLAPVVMLLSVFLIRRLGLHLISIAGSATANAGATPHLNADQDIPSLLPGREWTLFILLGSMISKYGHTADDLATAISSKQTKFELDKQLVDSNGYPVLSSRIADLEDAELFSQFEQWRVVRGLSGEVWEPEDKRAISLAHDVFMGLVNELLSHPQLSVLKADVDANIKDCDWPTIYLISILPSRWTERQKQSVSHWFADLIVRQEWPAEKFAIHPLSTLNNADPLIVLDRLNVQVHQQDVSGLFILMASESFLGEKIFAAWQAGKQRFVGLDKAGRIPGEAAGGLVMADKLWADRMAIEPMVRVHRVAQRKRDKSADDAGRIKPDTLIATIQDALMIAGVNADQIAALSADTDARASRVGELFEALNEVVPDMDLDANCFRLEADCGALGDVSGLAALLTARQKVIETEQAVLCVCNNDGFARSALVLSKQDQASTEKV